MGEAAERRAFRRRLGVTLSKVRTRPTDYTQETIAQELGVDVQTVGGWERGERGPKTYDLHRLPTKYDVPGEWFLFPTDSVTELDLRIETRRDAAFAAGAIAAAREDLEQAQAKHRDVEDKRASRRDRRPA